LSPSSRSVGRKARIAIGIAAALAVLLGLNALITGGETKSAAVTVPGGRILELPGGNMQVVDRGPRRGMPIVLIHGFTGAIEWWDRMTPLLARRHRVVAVDLLGHGGSEKPGSGYSMENQAKLVSEALHRLGVRDATVVGHSMGAVVGTALIELSPPLVKRLVIVDQAPDSDGYGADLPFAASLTFTPVLGEALWRMTPDFAIEDGLSVGFAPDYDVPSEFVEDFRRLTYSSYDGSAAGESDYTDALPLDERLGGGDVPLLAIFGVEEQIYDPEDSLAAYAAIGAETRLVPGAGHSPNVEKPALTASLAVRFAHSSTAAGSHRNSSGEATSAGRNATAGKKRAARSGRPR
jgi:pimeloyl-ACP methyl ester carboxylesterase